MRLAYLGPAGTFTEEAALAIARRTGAELLPYPSVPDTIDAVLDDVVDGGLVPIENSLEGTVNATVDALSADDRLTIVGEEVLAVTQCLIARTEIALGAVEEVVSHPQGLAQCARFLRETLPGARLLTAPSTAEAVRSLASAPSERAAIGSRHAATAHGGVILRAGIEDEPGNETRFVWLALAGRTPFPPTAPGAAWRSSILFAGDGDATPGWLVGCLSEFAERGVNLVKIESRPARSRLGHYVFLIDCEGAATTDAVAAAVAALRPHCDRMRVLGSYPAAAR